MRKKYIKSRFQIISSLSQPLAIANIFPPISRISAHQFWSELDWAWPHLLFEQKGLVARGFVIIFYLSRGLDSTPIPKTLKRARKKRQLYREEEKNRANKPQPRLRPTQKWAYQMERILTMCFTRVLWVPYFLHVLWKFFLVVRKRSKYATGIIFSSTTFDDPYGSKQHINIK